MLYIDTLMKVYSCTPGRQRPLHMSSHQWREDTDLARTHSLTQQKLGGSSCDGMEDIVGWKERNGKAEESIRVGGRQRTGLSRVSQK